VSTVPDYLQHAHRIAAELSSADERSLQVELDHAPHSGGGTADVWLWVIGSANRSGARSRLHELRRQSSARPVIAVTVDLDSDQLLDLVDAGASDFSALPFDGADCAARIHRVVGRSPQWKSPDVRTLTDPAIKDLVGSSANFVRQLSSLPTIAGCNAGVLILGETGTGKELFAEAIHRMSARASKPWVAVNCGGIPAELIESELFGHVRGAFTGASCARTGLVREAEGGTLFLDEVDSLPYGSQSKLLRFLQDKSYRQVGSSKLAFADVRVIASSNQDVPALIAQGRFRQDLYFRLNVLSIHLPPLRERREDIPLLALHFVRKACEAARRSPLSVSPALLAKWQAHHWPGNVRELRHAVERAVLFTDPRASCIHPQEESPLALHETDSSFQSAKARIVSHFERSYLEQALRSCDGNITRAAGIAGKNRRAFFELLRKHQINADHFRQTGA
jgi:DNA-binding NtrC family response regulator